MMFSFPTAIGDCALEWDNQGVTRVQLPRVPAARRASAHPADRPPARAAAHPPAHPANHAPAHLADHPPAHPADHPPAHIRQAAELIARLLSGEPADLGGIPVSHGERIEPFARRVYAATREIGPGETTSYGEIACRLGDRGAARAVGAALGANPTPIIVPCHRVLAADGSLHGFSAPGGIRTKRRLLEIEGAPGFTQQPLFA
jgi:methylated-DNA-[protein]-cysteine S-methyltransferase